MQKQHVTVYKISMSFKLQLEKSKYINLNLELKLETGYRAQLRIKLLSFNKESYLHNRSF